MKIEVSNCGELLLKEVYNGVLLVTKEGNKLGICMRDDTFELTVISKDSNLGKNYRINTQTDSIELL